MQNIILDQTRLIKNDLSILLDNKLNICTLFINKKNIILII
jgi:hypothetical protein